MLQSVQLRLLVLLITTFGLAVRLCFYAKPTLRHIYFKKIGNYTLPRHGGWVRRQGPNLQPNYQQ